MTARTQNTDSSLVCVLDTALSRACTEPAEVLAIVDNVRTILRRQERLVYLPDLGVYAL
jgi:hypothetical protein